MKPEQEADLVEKMAIAAYGDSRNELNRAKLRAALRIAEPAIRAAALEEAAAVAAAYAEANITLAGDSILYDPTLRGDFSDSAIDKHESLVIDGCVHSSMFHAAQNIANAILSLKSTNLPAPQETK